MHKLSGALGLRLGTRADEEHRIRGDQREWTGGGVYKSWSVPLQLPKCVSIYIIHWSIYAVGLIGTEFHIATSL